MLEIVTIGSALVDIFVSSPDLQATEKNGQKVFCEPFGAKIELDSMQIHTGGAGSNTAVGFTKLGFQTAAICELGTDPFSLVVVADFEKNGVKTEFLIREKKEQTGGSVIVVGKDGGRTAMVHRGAAAELNVSDIPEVKLKKAQWIHLSSIGGKKEVLQHIFQTARRYSLGLSWNPGQPEIKLILSEGLSGLGVSCRLLFVNREEWQQLQPQHELLQTVCEEIIVTNGKSGGEVWQHGKMVTEYDAPPTQSVDDTGAGDAFATAYAAAFLLEKPLNTRIAWGVSNGASVVQKVGAKPGLLERADLETIK